MFVSTAQRLGAEVNVQVAGGVVEEQISQIEYFIKKNMDVIVVIPIDGNALYDVLKEAREMGIYIICYDRIVENVNADLYITIDNEKVGTLMGEALIQANSGLVWSVARRFFGRGVDPDDLYQLGCLGFLKAVAGFDLSYGTQFSTYAVPKIAGEIRRFLRDDGTIKVSRSLKERAALIRTARQRLTGTLGREPRLAGESEATALQPEDIAVAETATCATESLQRRSGEDGFALEDVLTEGEMEEKILERIALREAIAQLTDREQMVIRLRYFHGLTQDKTAKILGVSQVQISRIEKKALAALRQHI